MFDIENSTGDPSYNYLCKGTSLELTRRLTQLGGVRVIAMHEPRTGAARQKVGRYELEGMLQAQRGHLRLSLLVTDNQKSKTVYSQSFEGTKVSDPLQLQSEIATGTVLALKQELAPGPLESSVAPFLSRLRFGLFLPARQVQSSPTNNHEAFDSYLRGHQLLEDFSSASNQAAITYLEKAVESDPNFALGYATLADAYLNMMNFYQVPQQELLDAARKNAETAVALDPSLAEAHGSLAVVLQTEWDWKGAERSFLETLRLKPSYAIARRRYAGLLLQFGRFDQAITMAREAYSQDPYDRGAAPGIGLYFFLAERYEDAIRFLESEIGDRDMPAARHNLGDAYAEMARLQAPQRETYFAKAFAQAAKVTAIELKEDLQNGKYSPLGDEMYAHYYSIQGNNEAAQPYFERMLEDMRANRASPAIVAWIYAVQGKKEQALGLLEKSLQHRDRNLFYARQFPALASLRNEPRFKRIVATMGLSND